MFDKKVVVNDYEYYFYLNSEKIKADKCFSQFSRLKCLVGDDYYFVDSYEGVKVDEHYEFDYFNFIFMILLFISPIILGYILICAISERLKMSF